MIQKSVDGLHQAEDTLNGKVKISEAEKLKILEQIGEASGRDVRIRILANQMREQAFEQAAESLGEWCEELGDRMVDNSQRWYSEHSPVWNQNKLIQDYINQFVRDLSRELDKWGNEQLQDIILKENLETLNTNVDYELDAIQAKFSNLEQQIQTNFSEQLKISIDGITDDFMGLGGIGGGLGIGGALAAGLIVFTGVGLIAVIVTAVATAIASSFGLGMLDVDGLHEQVKQKVLEIGLDKFTKDESIDKIIDKLEEILHVVFNSRVESANRVVAQAITLYEHLIEQQEKVHQETLEQREIEKAWIYQKCQELERSVSEIEEVLS
ncbi:hypothetical protein WA1_41825 [Scytonema hofmannii PCC 7110]|uniref:Dynamin-like helical domain-containing protein n=1 Tax=Scytonema hofmannii PCC 7110 TaxID=128403 RepID=A0A139WV00_9CYAN|nr:hypothetical protein [Scytonema hofmannii]KYC36268.1 hypothetical protein WA1_41825 [Scytonema hofmannii PCC 7110]